MDADPARAIDDLLTRIRAALSGRIRTGREPTTGTSDDGLVSATVAPDGYVRAIAAHPTVLRGSANDLADSIMAAVNHAVDARPDEPATDTLVDELKALQEESEAQVRQMSGQFVAAVKQVEPR